MSTASSSTAPAIESSLDEAGALAPLVSPGEAATRVAAGAVLIDVRSAAGRAASGTIPGAIPVDRYQVDALFDLAGADHLSQVTGNGTAIVVVCGSVRGSGPVAAALIAKGFTDVVHVEGGFSAWQDAGLLTEAPDQLHG